MQPSRRQLRAFTLIELLVVIGVIAILLALLLPTMSRARRAAGQLKCSSNLRQWAVGAQVYANDNRGYLPRRGQGMSVTTQITRPTDWFNAIPPYFQALPYMDLVAINQLPRAGQASVWICPQAADIDGPNYWSYGMNMALSVWETAVNDGNPDKITGVGNTAVMVLLTDAPGNHCSVFPSMYPDGYNPVPRHTGRVNIAFLDTHVVAVPGPYIGCGAGLTEQTDVRWHPPGSAWDGAK